MTEKDKIISIYELFRAAYSPYSTELSQSILRGKLRVERQTVMFPPQDGVAIEAQHVEAGFLKRDCAILTAFRTSRTLEQNKALNLQLRSELESFGLKPIPVDGCYREARESEASKEDSFFVYDDGTHHVRDFFTKVYQLSEKYEQDSFLYKSAGMNRTAFLISTNDDARKQVGDIKLAGRLYLNLEPVGPYTIIGATCVRFEENEPNS